MLHSSVQDYLVAALQAEVSLSVKLCVCILGLAGSICFGVGIATGIIISRLKRSSSSSTIKTGRAEPRFSLRAKTRTDEQAVASTLLAATRKDITDEDSFEQSVNSSNRMIKGIYSHIRSDDVRSSLARVPADNEYCPVADTAREELFFLLGVIQNTPGAVERTIVWQHVYSNDLNHFWVSNSTRNGIIMRGHSFVSSSPKCIMNWLLEQDLVTGIEGLGRRVEVKRRVVSKKEVVIERKLYCKPGSNSIMSSKRDFSLITSISLQEDGSYVIATRSRLEDILRISTSTKGSDSTKGYVRGVVYGSGYILTPVFEEIDEEQNDRDGDNNTGSFCQTTSTTDAATTGSSPTATAAAAVAADSSTSGVRSGQIIGCDVSFACNLDMMGAGTGRGNTSTTNIILSSVLRTLQRLEKGCANTANAATSSTMNDTETSALATATLDSTGKLHTLGAPAGAEALKRTDSLGSSVMDGLDQPALMELTGEVADQLAAMAKGAVLKLRFYHSQLNVQLQKPNIEVDDIDNNNPIVRMAAPPAGSFSSLLGIIGSTTSVAAVSSGASAATDASSGTNSWERFYDQDGIALYELSKDPNAPIGVLAATCRINVSECADCASFFRIYEPQANLHTVFDDIPSILCVSFILLSLLYFHDPGFT